MLVFFGLALVSAQNHSVEGTVQYFHDKTMLENSVVKIGEFTAKTDKKAEEEAVKMAHTFAQEELEKQCKEKKCEESNN